MKKKPLSITADKGAFTSEGDSTLDGHVHLIHGNCQIFADQATVHRDPKKENPIDNIQAEGHVKITEPNIRIDGTHATVFIEPDMQNIQDANFRLYDRHARGSATTISLSNKTEMVLKNATYTTCSPCQNAWMLKAKHLDLNQKTGRGHAHHARLYVKDIPIFYMPYVDFPIDDRRQSGLLYPVFGSTNRSGIEVGIPFYWNLAPNYDATLTPKTFSKRGLELQGLFRYLSSTSQGEIEGSFLARDQAYKTFLTEKRASHPLFPNNDPRVRALKTSSNREALRFKHRTHFNKQFSTNVDYHTVRDDNYFMDFGNNIGLANTTQLLQQGELLYKDNHWNVEARLQQYQTLHPFEGPATIEIYRRLPQVSLQTTYPDLAYGLQLDTLGEFARFTHKKDPFNGNTFTTGDRFQIRPSLSLPVITPGWYIRPRIQLDMLAYSLSLGTQDSRNLDPKTRNPKRTLPIIDIDSGLTFERPLALQKDPYIQTLEPRAYYLYVPYRNQNLLPNFDTSNPGFDYNQLYWDNRFTGLDRLGDAHQVTLGLSSRFFAEKTGYEKLSLTAGQIFYFKDREVTSCSLLSPLCAHQELLNRHRKRSALVGLAHYALQEDWSLGGNIEWDPYQKRADKKALSVQYQPDERSVLNIGYQFLRRNPAKVDPTTQLLERLDQTDTSIAWPITEQWRLLGRWHYDIRNRRSNDISMGIEQQGCCTAVRLFVTQFLQPFDDKHKNEKKYTNAIFLQFVFKGFAGVGHNKIDSTLKRAIPDYQWRDDNF